MSALRQIQRRRVHLVALTLALMALSACGGNEQEPPPRPTDIDSYTALGDSYAAGAGLSPVVDAGCNRTSANYGSLVADDLAITDYKDATCGGATTSDLVKSQTSKGAVLNAPQLASVTSGTDLVTIGMGLNNSGISVQAQYICLPQLNLTKECAAYLDQPDSIITDSVDLVATAMKTSLEAIRKKAPNAMVILVGYPHALPDTGQCPDILNLTGKAADRLRQTLEETNKAYQKIAGETGVTYLDMYSASQGHDMCSRRAWVNGDKNGGSRGAALHPTPSFQRAVADRIVQLVQK